MKKITFSFLLLYLLSCRSHEDFKDEFNKQAFDQTIIQNLNEYDSLRQIILSNYDAFDLSSSNIEFIYYYNFDSSARIGDHRNTGIPKRIFSRTDDLFKRIGRDNIFGFILLKDSSLVFLIRNTHLPRYYLDVRERLHWLPESRKIVKTSFPSKDTILQRNWQYQIWYDKRAEF